MELTNSITNIEECLSDIDKWMSINRLKLNKDKTELLYLFSKYNPQESLPPLRFGTDTIKPSSHARNIGAIFDTTMSMLPHVNNVCKSAFYRLHTISRIRKYLSTQTTDRDSCSRLVTSKLNHCNSLLYNVPKNVIKKFQSVQNAAARLIIRFRKCDHITPILLDLHWLPVSKLQIKFKILLLTFKALHQQSLTYIQDLIIRYLPSSSFESSFTLSPNPVSFNLKTHGSRAFSVSAPELWNKLSDDIRSCENLRLFKHRLKTHLFKNYYFIY